MLSLIGVGLYDDKDVTVRGLREIEDCDSLFLETYTSKWVGKEKLEDKTGKDIKEVSRSDLEEEFGRILDRAGDEKVGVLIPG
ncbi:MAG: diphthine synthase, partial [Candidatus Aenigmatarchaeota archaeon]